MESFPKTWFVWLQHDAAEVIQSVPKHWEHLVWILLSPFITAVTDLVKHLDRSLTFAESLTASSTRFVHPRYLAWMAEQLQLFSVIFLAFKTTSSEGKQKLILKLKAEIFKLKAEIETFKDNKNGGRVWRLYFCVFNKDAEKKAIKSFKKALFFPFQIHCKHLAEGACFHICSVASSKRSQRCTTAYNKKLEIKQNFLWVVFLIYKVMWIWFVSFQK